MPGNCWVSGLRQSSPSSKPSQWKYSGINVKLAPTCSTVTGPFKGGLQMALCLKVSRGRKGGVFEPLGQLEFSLRLERTRLTHLGGTPFCRIGSQACALSHLSHWAKTPWLFECKPLAVKAITLLINSLYSYYPPVLDMAMKVNLNPV